MRMIDLTGNKAKDLDERDRAFAPAQGSDARAGWDKCLDLRPEERERELKNIVKAMDEPGMREFASGWMDAWDTFGKATWDEIKKRMKGDRVLPEAITEMKISFIPNDMRRHFLKIKRENQRDADRNGKIYLIVYKEEGTSREIRAIEPQEYDPKYDGHIELAIVGQPILDKAAEIGRKAFEDGKPISPVSSEVLKMIAGPISGAGAKIIKAYQDGWIRANLAAPVPESSERTNVGESLTEQTDIEDETLDDTFDNIVRKLIILGSIDALQDVDFDENTGSIYLFMDAQMGQEEAMRIQETINGMYAGTVIAASPSGVIPEGTQPADWWVFFIPQESVSGQMGYPQAQTWGAEPEMPRVDTQLPTAGAAVQAIAQGVDVGAAINSLVKGESIELKEQESKLNEVSRDSYGYRFPTRDDAIRFSSALEKTRIGPNIGIDFMDDRTIYVTCSRISKRMIVDKLAKQFGAEIEESELKEGSDYKGNPKDILFIPLTDTQYNEISATNETFMDESSLKFVRKGTTLGIIGTREDLAQLGYNIRSDYSEFGISVRPSVARSLLTLGQQIKEMVNDPTSTTTEAVLLEAGVVQRLLFPADKYTVASATAWAKKHDYPVQQAEKDPEWDYVHVKVRDKKKGAKYRIVKFGDSGIEATLMIENTESIILDEGAMKRVMDEITVAVADAMADKGESPDDETIYALLMRDPKAFFKAYGEYIPMKFHRFFANPAVV